MAALNERITILMISVIDPLGGIDEPLRQTPHIVLLISLRQ